MTAIRINLLPHREIKRARQQQLFAVAAVATVAAGALVVFAGHLLIARAQENQTQRNNLLRQEITVLDGQIKEIQQLKEKTQSLLARKDVVESLQTNRTQSVHLFDELARRVPEGVYLKGFQQKDDVLSLQGYAQSSARVSSYMRNLDESPWFEAPNLVEVRAAQLEKQRVSEFVLTVKQSKEPAKEVTKEVAKAEGGA